MVSNSVECGICLDPFFESGDKTPLVLDGCGHSICRQCLERMCTSNVQERRVCPFCKVALNKRKVEEYNPNYSLIHLIPELKKTRTGSTESGTNTDEDMAETLIRGRRDVLHRLAAAGVPSVMGKLSPLSEKHERTKKDLMEKGELLNTAWVRALHETASTVTEYIASKNIKNSWESTELLAFQKGMTAVKASAKLKEEKVFNLLLNFKRLKEDNAVDVFKNKQSIASTEAFLESLNLSLAAVEAPDYTMKFKQALNTAFKVMLEAGLCTVSELSTLTMPKLRRMRQLIKEWDPSDKTDPWFEDPTWDDKVLDSILNLEELSMFPTGKFSCLNLTTELESSLAAAYNCDYEKEVCALHLMRLSQQSFRDHSSRISTEIPLITVYVKTVMSKVIPVQLFLEDTIWTLKYFLKKITGTPVEMQQLIASGKRVENEQSLTSCGIEAESTLHIVINMRGSDERLKTDIHLLGESPSGIPVYSFRYKADGDQDNIHMGTMAQDLLRLGREDAVMVGDDGMYLVNYALLDIPLL